jgi:hypothetical protein
MNRILRCLGLIPSGSEQEEIAAVEEAQSQVDQQSERLKVVVSRETTGLRERLDILDARIAGATTQRGGRHR